MISISTLQQIANKLQSRASGSFSLSRGRFVLAVQAAIHGSSCNRLSEDEYREVVDFLNRQQDTRAAA